MILAIDLGSTSFKAAVFDAALTCRGAGAHPIPHRFAPGGVVEIEVDDAIRAFREAIAGALREAAVAPDAIGALSVGSQAQTFTIVDPDGRPKMPFISWQDVRAQDASRDLQANPRLADFARHSSFDLFYAALQVCQVRQIQMDRPGFIRPDDRLLNLPTFLVERCTGKAVLDDNLAAMCGFYSLVQRGWWEEALAACGIGAKQLPRVVGIGSVAALTGSGARDFHLPAGIPVVLAGNDQTAGAYGARIAEQDATLLTMGTAQVVYTCRKTLPEPAPELIRGPYPGGLSYGMMACSGGNIVNWAQSVIAGCGTDETFFAQAAKAESGCRGLAFDSHLPEGAGRWEHVGLHHGPPDFARSVVESLADRMVGLVRSLGVDPARARFLAAGGGSRAAVWIRILSEKLGAELNVTDASPLLGAARMAREAAGQKGP